MEEDDKGIDIEDECQVDKQNLGGRLVLMLLEAGVDAVGGRYFCW